MKEYPILTVKGSPEWGDIPVMQLDNVLWTPDTNIRAEGQLCAGPEDLYVHMRAVEEDIRAEYTEPLSPVYRDSCLEFFFMPEPGNNYFNFEMNPNGCLVLQYGNSSAADRVSLVREDEKEYFDIHTNRTSDGWEIFYRIPHVFISLFYPDCRFGGVMTGNMYKCGGSTRHFLSWSPVRSENPDFHRPQDFGKLRFV